MTEKKASTLQEEGEAFGLPYCIVENVLGVLCGYVGVPKGHPFWGLYYDRDELENIEVHGGLTFSNDRVYARRISINDNYMGYWWFGFDCAHFMDAIPMDELPRMDGAVLRNKDYVRDECLYLAEQLVSCGTSGQTSSS